MKTATETSTAGLNERVELSMKLTVQEKLILLEAIRSNISRQLETVETFHGTHAATSSLENVGRLTRIERTLEKLQPKRFDLFA